MTGKTEQEILALTLYGEARNQGIAGMSAVASVVMNRVRHGRAGGRPDWWGEGVRGVCLKHNQFCCWNRDDPNHRIMVGPEPRDHAYELAKDIAARALAGELVDNTGGAYYYHAKGCHPVWARGATPTATIGDHIFYRDVA